MSMARWLIGCLTLSLTSVNANAQDPATFPQEGQRIRITAPTHRAERVTGTFVALRADTLFVMEALGERAVPLAAVTRLDVSRGMRGNTGKGARLGLVSGLAVGGVVGYVTCNASTSPASCFESQEGAQLMFLLLWAASGAGGALLGAAIGSGSRSEHWQPVPLDRVSLGVAAPGPGRAGLQLQLRF